MDIGCRPNDIGSGPNWAGPKPNHIRGVAHHRSGVYGRRGALWLLTALWALAHEAGFEAVVTLIGPGQARLGSGLYHAVVDEADGVGLDPGQILCVAHLVEVILELDGHLLFEAEGYQPLTITAQEVKVGTITTLNVTLTAIPAP
jgi:hypothetical protein